MDVDLDNLPPLALIGVLVVGVTFVALAALERLLPLRRRRFPAGERAVLNFSLAALGFGVSLALAWVLRYDVVTAGILRSRLGLLNRVGLPEGVGMFVFGLALYDLTYYYWHMALHRVPWLWRFHCVHHTDPDMDVTTAVRFHAGERVIGNVFSMAQIGLIGLGGWPLGAAYIVFHVCLLFHHSNVRLPFHAERVLNIVMVTPRMHGIHHSVVRDETNSNYAVITSVWDRLHGTLRLNVPQNAVDIGVAAYRQPGDNAFEPAVVQPFVRQREYWRLPNGEWPERKRTAADLPETLMP